MMTPTIRDIAYQLRQGKLIALADETGWSLAVDPVNDNAVAQLLSFAALMPAGLKPTVVIQNTDQLGLYVLKLPDVAYDLVEFAENPLTVVYDQGKNISLLLWKEGQPVNKENITASEVAVRRALNSDIQRLIGSFGRGLLTLPFESLELPKAVEPTIVERFGTLPGMPKRSRIMRLKANGEVHFIRK